ncbi:heterogeneous nuclear ribonucleoprotein L-like [Centruroides sculpturatus]|uniref:heterogeneous nuclear ribonucleoprotein L-like n=1 Tax=Centruroides sculpturatus TaxID=218467 RepID=UPI000C6D444D|nr:heterogeneous nuclear ribonucleoprotein L-like [Centruroides sculpturatus]
MANYDGHVAKRQKTEGDNRGPYGQYGQSYGGGYNNRNRGPEEEKLNHILLMTIQNPAYPITVDVIHTICNPSGKVHRIVIFKKNGVQAMVEFDSIESAKRAKESLNGADIYSGCCTLKIEYAKPTRLNVHKNDNESWDYTNPSLGGIDDHLCHRWGSSKYSLHIVGHLYWFLSENMVQDFCAFAGASFLCPTLFRMLNNAKDTPHHNKLAGVYRIPIKDHRWDKDLAYVGSTKKIVGGKISDRPALLQEPRGYGSPPYRDGAPRPGPPAYPDRDYDGYGGRGPSHGYGNGDYGPPPGPQSRYGGPLPDRYGRYESDMYDGRNEGPPPGARGPLYGPGPSPGGPGGPQQGSVVMIYGLAPDKMNADRLFNLFCLYGNVVRVSIPCYSKQAFLNDVQQPFSLPDGTPSFKDFMGNRNNRFTNPESAELSYFSRFIIIKYLYIFSYSKQAFLNDVQQPFSLPDGTPSFKDFMGNRNNRFTNPESAGKNRIQPPSKILHFFNAPYGIKEDELKKVFEEAEVKPPVSIKMFPSKTERSSSGLLEFEKLSEALEALVMCNHTPISNQGGKFPYILKLCFSFSTPRF